MRPYTREPHKTACPDGKGGAPPTGSANDRPKILITLTRTVAKCDRAQKTTISSAPVPKVGDTVDVTGVKLPDRALIADTITRK